MATMVRRFVLLAAMLVWQTGLLRADNPPPYSSPEVPWNQPLNFAPQMVQSPMPISTPSAPSGMPGVQPFVPPAQYALPQPLAPPWNLAAPPGMAQSSMPLPTPAAPSGLPVGEPYAPPAQFVLPQPTVRPENLAAPPPVNGTWHDDGQYVIIEVNGQQLRLAKSALGQQQVGSPAPSQIQIAVGCVHGRLFQRGRALVGCNVVIVPMHKDGAADDNGIRHPLSAITDADGVYGFDNVPIGAYKLTWLPAGSTQWIRRIEMKPDVFVHEGQDVMLKDIHMATQTIN